MTKWIESINNTSKILNFNPFQHYIFLFIGVAFFCFLYWLLFRYTVFLLLRKIYIRASYKIRYMDRKLFPCRKAINFEKRIARKLRKMNDVVAVYRDVYVYNDKEKKVAQIDIIAITKHAVFAIECKNYNGEFYPSNGHECRYYVGGERKNYHMTQIHGLMDYVYNPGIQNYNHIKFLQKLEPELTTNLPIVNLVVFPNNVLIDYDRVRDTYKIKLTIGAAFCIEKELKKFVQFYQNQLSEQTIDYMKVSNIIKTKYVNVNKDIKKRHARYIATLKKGQEDLPYKNSCFHDNYNKSTGVGYRHMETY